jgi:site-specific recombinase XerD
MERLTLDELQRRYLTDHRARGSSLDTIKRYQATFALFAKFLGEGLHSAEVLTSDTMQQFAIWLRETPVNEHYGSTTRSAHGTHAHLRDMRAWTRWLVNEELIEPVKVTFPKLPQRLFPVLGDEDMDRLWKSRYLTGPSELSIRNRALLGLMLDTGLRRSEVASLTLENTDLYNQLVTVVGKGDKQRRVPFSASVKVLLTEWIRVRGEEPGSLFWLASQSVRTVFRRIQADVGLEKFFPHLFRHQAATMMVRANLDVATVQRILGHADISTTLKYLSLSDDDMRTKHASASPYERVSARQEPTPIRGRRRLKSA